MSPAEVLQAVGRCGGYLEVEDGRLHYSGPRSGLTSDLRQAIAGWKDELLSILSGKDKSDLEGIPSDGAALLVRWEELGRPMILLSPGLSISNLETWLDPNTRTSRSVEHLATLRRFILEGLTKAEVLQADPFLEEWFRVSIPDWRRILLESIGNGDNGRAEYARWMLRDILQDPDYEEPDA